MAKERGAIVQVWRAFIASLKPRMARVKFVGEDYNGTKYYEDPEARRQRGRTFVPVDANNFMQENPAEWESWLRYRRQDPPTDEEIKVNYDIMMEKKKNAAEIEINYIADMKEKYGNDGKSLEIAKNKVEFPTYDDYKSYGQNYQIKKPK